jgi:hypothetical protein
MLGKKQRVPVVIRPPIQRDRKIPVDPIAYPFVHVDAEGQRPASESRADVSTSRDNSRRSEDHAVQRRVEAELLVLAIECQPPAVEVRRCPPGCQSTAHDRKIVPDQLVVADHALPEQRLGGRDEPSRYQLPKSFVGLDRCRRLIESRESTGRGKQVEEMLKRDLRLDCDLEVAS